MGINRRTIPLFPLSDYQQASSNLTDFSADTLESSLTQHPYRARLHYHPFYQVVLAVGDGMLMHDFTNYSLAGANLIFISPGQVHYIEFSSQLSGALISFSKEFFDHGAPGPSRLLDYPFFYATNRSPVLPLNPRELTRFRPFFQQLLDEYHGSEPGAAEIARATLQIIFAYATRLHPTGSHERFHPLRPSRPSQLVKAFLTAVENHFQKLDLIEEYAALLKVSPNHLNDTVREQTGVAAGETIRQRRLLEAKRLLLHSDLSISEIGYALGFQDASYFSRTFRRSMGQSPGEFRREIREKYHQGAL